MTIGLILKCGGAVRYFAYHEIISAALSQKRQPVIPSAVKSNAMNGVEESQVAGSK